MWRKIGIGILLFLVLAVAGLYFSLPRIAEFKLHKALEKTDSASFGQLEINFWDGNIALTKLYVLDTSGRLAAHPLKLELSRISLHGLNIIKLIKSGKAEIDSFTIGRGNIELPLYHKDSNQVFSKLENRFLGEIVIKSLLIDSVHFYFVTNRKNTSQHISGSIHFDASDVVIPLVNEAPLGWKGNLLLRNLSLNDSLAKLTKLPIQLYLDKLALRGLNANNVKTKGNIKADTLLLGNGWIKLDRIYLNENKQIDTLSLQKLNLNSISLNYFKADSLDFSLELNPKNRKERIETNLKCEAEKIEIPLQKEAPLAYNNLSIRLQETIIWPKNSIAFYTLKDCSYSSLHDHLVLEDFKIRQNISETRFAKHFDWDKTFVKLDVYKTVISGIPHDLKKLSDGINFKKIKVLDAQAYLYKDKRLPHPTTPKMFPIEALFALDFPVQVDSLEVKDSQLLYNENWREDYVPGRLSLTDINVTISNLSTKRPNKKGDWAIVKGKVKLLNKLELDIDWRFDLRKKGREFTLNLGIGACSFESLNPFTQNTLGMRFKQGALKGGRLRVKGDKKSGSGTLDLFYENMKVEFMNKQTHEQGFVNWAGAGLANLLVRNNNLERNNPKQGVVYAEPQPDRAIFTFIVKLFFAGFQDIAVGSKNQKKIEEKKRKK